MDKDKGLSLSSITVTAHEFKGKKKKKTSNHSMHSMAELHTGLKQAPYQSPP